MVIHPMIRNSICMNAHPAGCALSVQDQIAYVRAKPKVAGPARVLVLGASGGYGLASRITAAYGCGAATLGVAFEKPASGKRTATPGWYNTRTFEEQARRDGLGAETLFGDAFTHEMRARVAERIQALFGQIDLFIYSLASGLRVDPDTGEQYRSVLKPIGSAYRATSLDPIKGELQQVAVEPANDDEVNATVKVMGGEDWRLWVEALHSANLFADGALTIAYSYIGPTLTQPIYRDGTIGKAKEHLEETASQLDNSMRLHGGRALVSINKALVTRASAVIPVVPLYLTILFKVMKQKKLHEGCIEQMHRLFNERLYVGGQIPTDDRGRIRLDDWEMRADVQREVETIWRSVNADNLTQHTDIAEYVSEFLHIHGFGYDSIDYDQDINP